MFLAAHKVPDWDYPYHMPHSAAFGVALGYDVPLPRTPAVYERKKRWKKYDVDLKEGLPCWNNNYVSALDNTAAIQT